MKLQNIKKYLITQLVKILSTITNKLNRFLIDTDSSNGIRVSEIEYNNSGKFYKFFLLNEKMLEHKKALKGIYNALMSNKKFVDFGFYKIIIIT